MIDLGKRIKVSSLLCYDDVQKDVDWYLDKNPLPRWMESATVANNVIEHLESTYDFR